MLAYLVRCALRAVQVFKEGYNLPGVAAFMQLLPRALFFPLSTRLPPCISSTCSSP